ncbi:serine hydrolase domain-containing protein [Xanthocytophaga agilis]|uniref:Serine hydrolase domain-containing protein n=1 Tax=Xanthocytophaga agilis TaxID=3048010 RepID=A0AAE3UEW5_9BACT|nr:serine hydrolase domain-containing protein [Xanthocytophaga agilis]MDJ1499968.1 serine hydrolase domain-containing protein [Xanthocytophaga agilis]
MKNILCCLYLLLFYPASGQTLKKESIQNKAWTKATRYARQYVDSLQHAQDIPGISVCVGNADNILWAEGFGLADLETHQPVTIHSRFRLGSVSKSLTSFAIGKLIEEKKLDLDIAIQNYVPSFPVKAYPFTARQLATHTSGIRHYRASDPLSCLQRYATVLESLSIFNKDSLLFKPGTAYQYSTYGYSLLSAVIEGASHLDYLTFMKQAVFDPLNMAETCADYSDSIVANRVRFYEHTHGKRVNATQVDNSYKWAGGGMLSTSTDLVRLGREFLHPTLLSQKTLDLLISPQLLLDGTNTHYGMGWRIGTDAQNRRIIHHGGLIDGGRAFLLIYPEHNLVVAILANMSGVTINLPEVETIAHYFFTANR